MKHLLNNISEEEKNRIREQHTGGMRIATDKFKKLVETKQGDVKLYLSEQPIEKENPIEKLKPIKLRIFPIVETTGEDGSPRWEKGKEPSFVIDVDKKPVEAENFGTKFSFSVRGRKEKGEGYYDAKNRDEIFLDSCYLKNMGEGETITDIFGRVYECSEEEEFRLSPEGAKLMQKYFGTNSYVSNDGGEDVSNMA